MSSFCDNSVTLESVPNMSKESGEERLHEADGAIAADGRDFIPFHHIYWHQECTQHNIEDHPEQPRRATSILQALRGRYRANIFKLAPLAKDEHILLFHTESHLKKFKSYCTNAEEGNKCVHYDGDTAVMPFTRNAAYRAVGAAIAAVDDIFHPTRSNLKYKTAFCCTRPPGHHAEPNRAMGFCFFNNAAIAARYAQDTYHISRVAVLDFDVHHGNGTEEGFKNDESLFYGSTHERNNYPGTGTDPSPFVGELARKSIDRRIVNRMLDSGPKSREQFRVKWREVVEEMVHFAPSFVILSAGFDAHDDDPLSDIELTEDDFAFATRIVLEACNRLNPQHPVPVMSILEGGYDLAAIARSALAHCEVLFEPFPEPTQADTENTEVGDDSFTEFINSQLKDMNLKGLE